MNLKFVDSLEKTIWREYVDSHPGGNIFHTPEMFQVFEQAEGYNPAIYACVDENDQVQALLPLVQVTLINGILRLITTRAIAYGGLLCASGMASSATLTFLLHAYSKDAGRKALFTELRNLSDTSNLQPVLRQCGYTFEDHLDYLIDLDCSPDGVLANIGSRTRKHIRKGLRKGTVTTEEITRREDISEWYDLLVKTYETAHVPLADRSLFEAAYEVLYPRGMVKFWRARIGSACVAVSIELLYKDIMYGWYGGVDRAYADEVPGELLMWHILKWGAENGYRIYDFGGAGKPNEEYGVRDFKAKFGGRLVNYGRNTWIPNRFLFCLSKAGYSLIRRLF